MDIKTHKVKIDWLGNGKYVSHGWGNGYVLVPEGHPLFGMHYDKISDEYGIHAHGGLTYASLITEKSTKFLPEHIGMYAIGFDCAHYGDNLSNCPESFVDSEILNLLEQISAIK